MHDEILDLRRELEKHRPESGMRFTLKEFIVVATSTLLSFAGMLSENEIVLYFCLAFSCAGYLYICLKHFRSISWRFVAATAVIGIFGTMMVIVHQRSLKKGKRNCSWVNRSEASLIPSDMPRTLTRFY
jgi:hypothetical protein